MSGRVLHVRGKAAESLREGIAKIQQDLKVSADFADDVEQAALSAAAAVRMPVRDLTDIDFVTIDPPGAEDLDQALHISPREGGREEGFVVRYAIADVMAFVRPGDAIDRESHRRGESLYGADVKIPLHPPALSEGAASLLPGQVTPAFVWEIKLDASGEQTSATVARARVRSREQLTYVDVQSRLDAGEASTTLELLRTVGQLRMDLEAQRGGVSLPMPQQEISIDGDIWSLQFREMTPAENWNAQISLMTGFAAAKIMMEGGVGLLRTLATPQPRTVTRLRRTARALSVEWPAEIDYPEFIRGLDPNRPNEAALVVAATSLLRGAGYVSFAGEAPEESKHAALAAHYAHVTAPLRRLIDRYGLEICAALCAGESVPAWVQEVADDLPSTMQESRRRSNAYENAVLNLVEAIVLAPHVGAEFSGVVLESEDQGRGVFQVKDPAVEASVTSDQVLPVGENAVATLVSADPATRSVSFSI